MNSSPINLAYRRFVTANLYMNTELELFKSLFKGRQDVFAVRWEKDTKSGYMPAYDFNWHEFTQHQQKGGSLRDFKNKRYAALTDSRLINHLSGKEIIGIYPLLPDNTSWFIAADFDESVSINKNWISECRLFIGECEKHGLTVYLERSRSGAGGHVWLFFGNAYPALKSRKIFNHLLISSGIQPGKNSSFDRLFPNQDTHSGKELGNLIALPLQKKSVENRNTCFIDPLTGEAFEAQWEFLSTIQKVSATHLDQLYEKITNGRSNYVNEAANIKDQHPRKLHITLDNYIFLSKNTLPGGMLTFLRESLNFINTEYLIKKSTGKNRYATEKYFKNVEDREDNLVIPRGFTRSLLLYCKQQNIDYFLEDKRLKLEATDFRCSASLHSYQQAAIDVTAKKDFGVIVSPPGSGKTIMGLFIIAKKQQPALIIVHRKQLFDQWIERIQTFLGIPGFQIGKIEGGKCGIGNNITVAMIQSLQSDNLPAKLYRAFGTIIVDECHHIPAKTFREVIGNFYSYYLYGFTATPFRKNKDEKLIFIHIGDILHEAVIPANQQGNREISVVVQNTELFIPFNTATDKAETLIHILIHDTARNELIVEDVKREVRAGRKILALTERKAHIEILYQYLKGVCEVIILTGEDSEEKRKIKFNQIENDDFQVLLATGQFIGEGMDLDSISCLVLAYPFSFEGKLVQYIGRVQRSAVTPIVYDYRDHRIEYLANLFKQRNKYYRKLLKGGQLSAFAELTLVFKGIEFCINESDKFLSIDCLEIPVQVDRFKDDIAWRIRIIQYNEEEGDLFSEILDYDFPVAESKSSLQGEFYFYGIERVRFRNIDTSGLLRSVVLEPNPLTESDSSENIVKQTISEPDQVFLKTMKVPFWKISFLAGAVSFPVHVELLNQEITFEIFNADIRPEFEAIREYFMKALKKKAISVEIVVRYNNEKIISAIGTSDDINNINNTMIDSMRFQFVKKEILRPSSITDKQMHTLDELPPKNIKKIYFTAKELIDDILNIKKSKHYLQLKYLAAKHEASVLKVRFVLQPFSFLFLLAGEKNYHVIWETLDTEEATYIWHTGKTKESLKKAVEQIETDLSEIQQKGRQHFLENERQNFSRIVHDYTDAKKGFVTWKGMMEERIN